METWWNPVEPSEQVTVEESGAHVLISIRDANHERALSQVAIPSALAPQVAAALVQEQIQVLRECLHEVSGFMGIGEELAAWHGFAAFESLRGKLAAAYQALAALAQGEGGA